jgi:hypothetical protein
MATDNEVDVATLWLTLDTTYPFEEEGDRGAVGVLREQTRILEAELSEAAARRLGHGFRVREIHIESGSIEVFALVTAASLAVSVQQYGALRQGLDYLLSTRAEPCDVSWVDDRSDRRSRDRCARFGRPRAAGGSLGGWGTKFSRVADGLPRGDSRHPVDRTIGDRCRSACGGDSLT